jgi:pseudouridylate synthase
VWYTEPPSAAERAPGIHMMRQSEEVREALAAGRPVVALESTVITHGLPRPRNREVAAAMEAEVRETGAVPATIGVLAGEVVVGLAPHEIDRLAADERARKVSVQGLGAAVAGGWTAGTTVAATAHLASRAGIPVFATGGIGGVHRGAGRDVSADLGALGRAPIAVVCAGPKAVLDLAATREALETAGVPVVGVGTDEMPGFYTAETGLPVDTRVERIEEVAALFRAHRGMGLPAAVLVVLPPPRPLAASQVEAAVREALARAEDAGVRGSDVTPYLLRAVAGASGGSTDEANEALLRANAAAAGRLAVTLTS